MVIAARIFKVRPTSRPVVSYIRSEFSPNTADSATRFDNASAAYEFTRSIGFIDPEVRIFAVPANKRGK